MTTDAYTLVETPDPDAAGVPIPPRDSVGALREAPAADEVLLDLDLTPYRVNAHLVAIRAVCEECGAQYDVRFNAELYEAVTLPYLYNAAAMESLCDVCWSRHLADDDTIPLAPVAPASVGAQRAAPAGNHIPTPADVIARLDALQEQMNYFETLLVIVLAHIKSLPAADSSPRLGQADVDLLHNLALKHTGRDIADLLNHLHLGSLMEFRDKYTALDDAQKAIASRIVDTGTPIMSYMAETKTGRNGALYLSVNFGFNNVSVFNGSVDALFKGTEAHLALSGVPGWRSAGFLCDFRTPVQIIMEREPNGYPRILTLKEIN